MPTGKKDIFFLTQLCWQRGESHRPTHHLMPTENHQHSQSSYKYPYFGSGKSRQSSFRSWLESAWLFWLGYAGGSCPPPLTLPITTCTSVFCTAASSWKTGNPIFTGPDAFTCLTFLSRLPLTFQACRPPLHSGWLGSALCGNPSTNSLLVYHTGGQHYRLAIKGHSLSVSFSV